MYTKFDKNLTSYLNNNRVYINRCNSVNNIEMASTQENTGIKNFPDEDDSVINNLPEMNEIEGYGNQADFQTDNQIFDFNIVNKYLTTPKTSGMILTHRSSISSASSLVSSSSNSTTSQQTAGNDFSGISSNGMQPHKKNFNRNIHCVKEKIRRDRIKFSCNELRRLIPNLNGIKTDMASLLETSVLWIQLINANIPEQLLINVQNKLENLKLMRSNRQQLASQKSPLLTAPLKNLKILSKDTLIDNLNLKQETYSPSPLPSFHASISHSPPALITSNNSSFISSQDSANTSFNQSICNLQQQQSKNIQFTSKPSKWLYSSNRSSIAFHHDQNNNGVPEYRCFMSSTAQNQNEFNSDLSFYNKAARKQIDFNNNNIIISNNNNNNNNKSNNNNNSMYLGQVSYSGQLEMQQVAYSSNDQASFQQANLPEMDGGLCQSSTKSQMPVVFYNQANGESMF